MTQLPTLYSNASIMVLALLMLMTVTIMLLVHRALSHRESREIRIARYVRKICQLRDAIAEAQAALDAENILNSLPPNASDTDRPPPCDVDWDPEGCSGVRAIEDGETVWHPAMMAGDKS